MAATCKKERDESTSPADDTRTIFADDDLEGKAGSSSESPTRILGQPTPPRGKRSKRAGPEEVSRPAHHADADKGKTEHQRSRSRGRRRRRQSTKSPHSPRRHRHEDRRPPLERKTLSPSSGQRDRHHRRDGHSPCRLTPGPSASRPQQSWVCGLCGKSHCGEFAFAQHVWAKHADSNEAHHFSRKFRPRNARDKAVSLPPQKPGQDNKDVEPASLEPVGSVEEKRPHSEPPCPASSSATAANTRSELLADFFKLTAKFLEEKPLQ